VDEVCDYNRSGERLTVPASNFKISIPEYSLNRPENIAQSASSILRVYHEPTLLHSIATWLENYPLATVQRAMHLTYPDSKAWVCQMDDSTHDDQDILRYFTWSAPVAGTSSRGVKNRQTSVVVIYQPPWILSSEDVERFVLCDSVRLYFHQICAGPGLMFPLIASFIRPRRQGQTQLSLQAQVMGKGSSEHRSFVCQPLTIS
jgi:hypothetical protein